MTTRSLFDQMNDRSFGRVNEEAIKAAEARLLELRRHLVGR